jgi:hypothetical protein
MALTDKNIVITPNIGSATADPKIVFSGGDAAGLAPQNITLQVYPTNNGTLSFEGSAGQLFSITNELTGTIFSVNDVSGIPSIEVLDSGLIKLGQLGGNVLIGTGVNDGINKLQVNGTISTTGFNVGTNTVINSAGNIRFDGTATTTNQDRGIFWTAYDKEIVGDVSDAAYIKHTVNVGGLAGSVLEISAQNDANDGVNIVTNSATGLRHNGNTIWTSANDGAGSGLDADLLDGLTSASINTASTVVTRDASGNFAAGTITATLTGTATQVSNTLTRGSYLTGSNFNGSAATTWAVDADSANTASKVVVRDASGNFSAGNITATKITTGEIQSTGIISVLNGGTAQGMKLGNLVISNSYSDGAPTNGIYSKGQINSGVATGTAPLTIASTTLVSNLNADLLDGLHSTSFSRRYTSTVNVTSTAFVALCNITGNNLSSSTRITVNGTSGGVVITVIADIVVNHSQDILISSLSGQYAELTIRVTTDANENHTIWLKGGSASNTSCECEVFPLNNETVTFSPTTTYSTITLDHVCKLGATSASATGGVAHEYYSQGNKVWHAGNDGAGSGLDADLLDGLTSSSTNVVSTVVTRDASGNFGANSITLASTGTSLSTSGRVGIGIAAPDQPLAFADGVGIKMQFNGVNTNGYQLGLATAVNSGDAMMKFIAGETSGGEFGFYNTTNLRLLINSSGNVGIGVTSPRSRLEVTTGTANTNADIPGSVATFVGATPSGQSSQVSIESNDAIAANTGGVLAFGGRYSGTALATWAAIKGLKEDATAGNYGGYLSFYTRTNGTGYTERMRINPTGNVGIGVTPSNWVTDVKAIEMAGGSLVSLTYSDRFNLVSGAYINASGWTLQTSLPATKYTQYDDGSHVFSTAIPTPVAGNPAFFSEALKIDYTGNVGIGGIITPSEKLEVLGNIKALGNITATGKIRAEEPFWENTQTITANYTVASTINTMTIGPITVADGVSVTVADGASWTVV